MGILNYETGRIYCEEHEKYDAEVFLQFLKNTSASYPTGKIVMIPDNARIHHAKLIQPFLEENTHRLTLMFLPPYSPNLNLIEGLWGWLKSNVVNSVFFSKVDEIRLAISSFLDTINKSPRQIIDRLCSENQAIYKCFTVYGSCNETHYNNNFIHFNSFPGKLFLMLQRISTAFTYHQFMI